MQAGMGQTVQTISERGRRMMACSTMRHARQKIELACLQYVSVRASELLHNSHSLYPVPTPGSQLPFNIRRKSISRSVHCRCPVSAQSFGPPPPSLFPSCSFSLPSFSRAPAPCLSCPPSCCPMGSSLDVPSKAAVVSDDIGGGGSVAGPVFTPAAETLRQGVGKDKQGEGGGEV